MDITNQLLPGTQVRNSDAYGNTTRMQKSVSMDILQDTPQDFKRAYSLQADRKQKNDGNQNQ